MRCRRTLDERDRRLGLDVLGLFRHVVAVPHLEVRLPVDEGVQQPVVRRGQGPLLAHAEVLALHLRQRAAARASECAVVVEGIATGRDIMVCEYTIHGNGHVHDNVHANVHANARRTFTTATTATVTATVKAMPTPTATAKATAKPTPTSISMSMSTATATSTPTPTPTSAVTANVTMSMTTAIATTPPTSIVTVKAKPTARKVCVTRRICAAHLYDLEEEVAAAALVVARGRGADEEGRGRVPVHQDPSVVVLVVGAPRGRRLDAADDVHPHVQEDRGPPHRGRASLVAELAKVGVAVVERRGVPVEGRPDPPVGVVRAAVVVPERLEGRRAPELVPGQRRQALEGGTRRGVRHPVHVHRGRVAQPLRRVRRDARDDGPPVHVQRGEGGHVRVGDVAAPEEGHLARGGREGHLAHGPRVGGVTSRGARCRGEERREDAAAEGPAAAARRLRGRGAGHGKSKRMQLWTVVVHVSEGFE